MEILRALLSAISGMTVGSVVGRGEAVVGETGPTRVIPTPGEKLEDRHATSIQMTTQPPLLAVQQEGGAA